MGKNKQLAVNMTAQILGFGVSTCISFFLTPYVVKSVGKEAYGFVGLANSFVDYANLAAVALNSMAGTFITIKLHKDDEEGANKYFTSVIIANIFLALVTSVLGAAVVLNLTCLVNVPDNILLDVKILWAFIFSNFALKIIGGTYEIATFARNRLDLSSVRNIQASILKGTLLVLMYTFLTTKVWYIGLTSFLCSFYVLIWNIHYTKRLLPNIKVEKSYFDMKAVIEMLKAGIWNTITRLGQLLNAGLDLLITNLFIGAGPMGTLSIAKTIPALIGNINGMLASVFAPSLTIAYAKGDKKEILRNLRQASKIMGITVNIPIAILIIYGEEFYALWMPNEDGRVLQILSIITILCAVVECSIMSIYYLFTALNKVKENSMSVLLQGVLNTIIVIILLKTTNLGIYAVAGVSSILTIIRIILFAAPYGARLLDLKWYAFFPEIIKSLLSVGVLSVISYIIKALMPAEGWGTLILSTAAAAILGITVNIILFLNKYDRKTLKEIIKNKVNKRN